ncbi:aldo/keto reductase [Lachnospiraceae bacterium 45-W7]
MYKIAFHNKVEIPQLGLGTWQITDKPQMADVIRAALSLGYRLIDTAAAYCNEMAIAKAIGANEVKREELFISDKVWNTSRGFADVQKACRKSLKKLKVDYLDMYLIHWPASMKLYPNWIEINADTWKGMEQLYRDGLVKSIGVCNFKVHHLQELMKSAEILPMINQIEMHPGMNQTEVLNYCNANGIKVEASSPLGNGQILKNEKLIEISKKKGKSAAQICLRWGIQKGVIVIPKTTNIERLEENINIFDFVLDLNEMEMIDNIPYCGGIGIDSDEVVEFG